MQLSSVPRFSAYDPPASGEGSIDPLGMEVSAERLAEQLLPGMTARMWRVRMLTFMAVSAHVTDPFIDEFTADQTTPSYLVFEWMYAEALARDQTEAASLPGLQTTTKALAGGGRLAARLYLKSPRALGIHGFYRRLAEATGIIDSAGRLRENGELLIEAWERDRGLRGFLDNKDEGAQVLDGLRWDLHKGLTTSKCALRPTSKGGMVLRRQLTPAFLPPKGRLERRLLRRLLDEDHRRRATFQVLALPVKQDRAMDERELAKHVKKKGERDIAAPARCLLAYENLAGLLNEAFELVLWRATSLGPGLASTKELTVERHRNLAKKVAKAVDATDKAAGAIQEDDRRDQLLSAFSHVRSGHDLVEALIDRHEKVQQAKSQEGKLPWLQRSETGLSVRSAYARGEEPPESHGFLHPVRLGNASNFLRELA